MGSSTPRVDACTRANYAGMATQTPQNDGFLQKLGMLKAPRVTSGHMFIAWAAVLGFLFVFFQTITIIVTVVEANYDWAAMGGPAIGGTIGGYVAGAGMAFLCYQAS